MNFQIEELNLVMLTTKACVLTNGGQSESEIRFLMDANGWSRSMACQVLGLADTYAALSSNPCTNFN